MKKNLIIGLAIAALFAAGIAYKMLTPKGEVDITSTESAYELKAEALYAAFEADEGAANAQYANTIVTVQGSVASVEENDAGQLQITLSTESALGAVVCTLQQRPAQAEQLAVGTDITLKGVCTGYLFDVVIDRAILLT